MSLYRKSVHRMRTHTGMSINTVIKMFIVTEGFLKKKLKIMTFVQRQRIFITVYFVFENKQKPSNFYDNISLIIIYNRSGNSIIIMSKHYQNKI